MFEQPWIQYHNFQISLFYILQFRSSYYFNFQLSLLINFLYFLKKRLQKLILNCFQQFLEPRTNLDPLNLEKMPLKNFILACLERSPSKIAKKKNFSFPFFLFLKLFGFEKCYLVQNFRKKLHSGPCSVAYFFCDRFFKNLTIYFPIQSTKSTKHPQKLRSQFLPFE